MRPDVSQSIVQEIIDPILKQKKIKLLMKRDDLIHPEISGNKWRKLKDNIEEARTTGHSTILSFGGTFSNHILALASAGKEFGFKTIGVIRGESDDGNNPTLSLAAENGMHLHFVSREEYRHKNETSFLDVLRSRFGQFFVLPEGGSNCNAIRGCQELVSSITDSFDVFCCSVGTGGTLAGVVSSPQPKKKVIGFSALKGDFLQNDVRDLLRCCDMKATSYWEINTSYHFGGYAKFDKSLLHFINKFYTNHKVPLDPIYTGKMLFGVFDLIKKDNFQEGSRIMVLHSGGLQGIRGFNILHNQAVIFE